MTPHDQPELAEGALVGGRYRLARVVGRGGMGVVWEATNTWTERRVAIKFMGAGAHGEGRATVSPEHADRFLREAKATARVRHPHVVDVLDMGNDPEQGGLFIVYDLLVGESLRALFDRRAPLSLDEALTLLAPAMDGVAEAHRCGVVHRDLKPENIFLARESGDRVVPRVIDFGIAKVALADEPDASLTRTGVALGTARYMSPEQCRGATDIDARTDVWALGVIWFEALTGRLPHEGDGYNQVISAVLTADAPPLRTVRPDAPAGVAAAIDRALARDREARTPSIEAFLEALRNAHSPTHVVTPAPPTRPRSTAAVWVALALLGAALVLVGVTPRAPRAPARMAAATVLRATATRDAPREPALPSSPRALAVERPDAAAPVVTMPRADDVHRAHPIAHPVAHRVAAIVARPPTIVPSAPDIAAPPTARAPNGAPVLEP